MSRRRPNWQPLPAKARNPRASGLCLCLDCREPPRYHAWGKPGPWVTVSATFVEQQISGLLGKYTPEIEAQLRDARTRLRAKFPRGHELVYDNYNALVFAISPSQQTSDAFVSVAGYPRWVSLFFLHGKLLPDPQGLLEGQGAQVRSIRLKTAAEIDTPPVAELIAQASLVHRTLFATAPLLATTIKSVSAEQRPRRPPSKASGSRS